MEATDSIVDAYPDKDVCTGQQVDQDMESFEIRIAPIFKSGTIT